MRRTALFSPLLTCLALLQPAVPGAADDWPQWRGPQRDGVWRESGILENLPEEPKYAWRTPVGSGFAGPAVADGKVFVLDRVLPAGAAEPIHQWDVLDPVEGSERVLCLDAASGKVLWQHEYPCRYRISYPSGPRTTPAVSEGKVYSAGAMGDLLCLDAADGGLLWSKNYVRDFGAAINPWGVSAAPLVDGDRLIVIAGGADGACVVALDKNSGQEIWRSLDAEDPGYSSPILIEVGRTRQLIVWNSLGVYSLDPATGEPIWDYPYMTKMAHAVATPIFDFRRRLLFVSSFFDGPRMLRLTGDGSDAELLWQGFSNSELPQNTDKIHCLMSTPAFFAEHLFGVDSYGQLRCLELEKGERIWETLAATGENRWSNAFLVRHEDRFFLFNEHGELILARLTPAGYEEFGRMKILEPTLKMRRREVVWSHPAFANRHIFARNDKEIVSVDLAAGP